MIKSNILITGSAGFIGFHISKFFLENYKNIHIFGVDNISDYYDRNLKKNRIKQLKKFNNFHFYKKDLCNLEALLNLFNKIKIDNVIHLAAQPGVRNSLKKPKEYFDNNILVHHNLLYFCKIKKIKKFFYASSSSVYGNSKNPFTERKNNNNQESFYASTKSICENLSYAYTYNFSIQTIGLRFFTVYGPYGRPDMAYYSFTRKILSGKKIQLYDYGKNLRDFTYIDDLVKIFLKIFFSKKHQQFEVYNIGSGRPISTIKFLKILEKIIGKKASIEKVKFFKGDVFKTNANMKKYKSKFGSYGITNLENGLINFYKWYNEYHN